MLSKKSIATPYWKKGSSGTTKWTQKKKKKKLPQNATRVYRKKNTTRENPQRNLTNSQNQNNKKMSHINGSLWTNGWLYFQGLILQCDISMKPWLWCSILNSEGKLDQCSLKNNNLNFSFSCLRTRERKKLPSQLKRQQPSWTLYFFLSGCHLIWNKKQLTNGT